MINYIIIEKYLTGIIGVVPISFTSKQRAEEYVKTHSNINPNGRNYRYIIQKQIVE